MKHIHTVTVKAELPILAQQSALEIKTEAFLDLMELGINKFPSPNFPRVPPIGGA